MTGRLLGIARHGFKRAPMETIERAWIGLAGLQCSRGVVLEITGRCDPRFRMEETAPGLNGRCGSAGAAA